MWIALHQWISLLTYWVGCCHHNDFMSPCHPLPPGHRCYRWQRSCWTRRMRPCPRSWSWRSSWCKGTRSSNRSGSDSEHSHSSFKLSLSTHNNHWIQIESLSPIELNIKKYNWDNTFLPTPCFCPSLTQEVYKDTSSQVHSLRQMLKEKDEAIQRQSNLEKKIHELEKQGTIKIHKKGDGDISILPSPPSGVQGLPGSVMMGGNSAAVSPHHTGVIAGTPAPPPPPPPPPLPVNGTCRLNISKLLII